MTIYNKERKALLMLGAFSFGINRLYQKKYNNSLKGLEIVTSIIYTKKAVT
jgi:hypothetical protein